jgi:Spy/CpxP family protein refolding chaperone
MKKVTFMLLGLFLISSFFFSTGALAGCCGGGGGMGGCGCFGGGPGRFVSSSVENLTPEQSDKLATLQQNHIKETATLRTDLAVKRIERDQLLAQSQPNRDEILSKQREITDLQAKLQEKVLTRELELKTILTSEQLNQLNYGYGSTANLLPGWGAGSPPGQGFGPRRGRGCMKSRGRCGSCW